MNEDRLSIIILGLSITSSWGNGHATTYRSLVHEMSARGHDILFLERDVPWYAAHRDLQQPDYCRLALYDTLSDLQERFADEIRDADAVIVGSYVPEGTAVGAWVAQIAGGVTAFYDIDTPVTLSAVARGECEYLSAELVPQFDIYFSFTGGPTLERLEREFGARRARPLYCSVDPELYHRVESETRWDLGYLGTYSADRQPGLERLMLAPAHVLPKRNFAVAGPQYPPSMIWPPNVTRIEHLPPAEHRTFYNSQRFTLNLTRSEMIAAGWSPSVRLFEAAACGTAIVSDSSPGLETFFVAGQEILVAHNAEQVVEFITRIPEAERRQIGERARCRVLAEHTATHRARELENYLRELRRQPVAA